MYVLFKGGRNKSNPVKTEYFLPVLNTDLFLVALCEEREFAFCLLFSVAGESGNAVILKKNPDLLLICTKATETRIKLQVPSAEKKKAKN